ncbi:ATP-binding cassette domain-containing protein [Streptosporangium sp. NPDC006007]|uniref:ATP-binding cassette domain-containing protein n=1 Tax=Streptosporangium sp. NPDC006007 TaxID=3154575 RepID=UPI0033B12577
MTSIAGVIAEILISPPSVLVVVATAGGILTATGELPLESFIGFLVFSTVTTAGFMTVMMSVHPLVSALSVSHSIRELLSSPEPPVPDQPVVPDPETPEPVVRIRGVRFAYGDTVALDGIDLALERGTVTALVGPSGSGKSTLLKLVGRFFDVDEGSVRIGGRDVRELGSTGVSRLAAQVFQDVYLLEGNVADNLRMANPNASDDDLERVARVARLDEVVHRLPRGWDTRVGEAGSALSGGEKQRVFIARALLKEAPVVLLVSHDDELLALAGDGELHLRLLREAPTICSA